MLALRDIMVSDIATLAPDDTLREAITLLSERCITGAPVVSVSSVVGVISAMDIMDFAANVARARADTQDTATWQAGNEAGEGNSGSFFTEPWDGIDDELEVGEEFGDVLEDHTVDEAMTRGLLMLPADTEVHAAAAFMIEHGIHRILVVDDGQLEGLVTTTDFLRLVADRRL
jgi:CBS domain-containing protein